MKKIANSDESFLPAAKTQFKLTVTFNTTPYTLLV